MRVLNVVGVRPNFVKIAPLLRTMRERPQIEPLLVHTGQHYSPELSDTFFAEMEIPPPDFTLGVGSGSHAEQTGRIMIAFEAVLRETRPDLVLVVGDVNSTIACALAAVKGGYPVAHVEAGLRSFDRSMPEEINRIVTDQISELLFTTSAQAGDNLQREGIPADRVHFVGNVMIDSLCHHLGQARARQAWRRWPVQPGQYAVMTLHRPANVDEDRTLASILRTMATVQTRLPVVFPGHPRTIASMEGLPGVERPAAGRMHVTGPLGYLDFVSLISDAALVFTDSGGVQEDCTYLGIPCLTLRSTTERPETVTDGTNTIVGTDPARIVAAMDGILAGRARPPRIPPLWDGHTAERIADILLRADPSHSAVPPAP